MLGSLYTGVSGVNAYTQAMAVVGDNIANVNTTGFKSSMATFETLMSQTLGKAGEVGRGVRIGAIRPSWAAGTVENTTSFTDMAINGTGLFVLKNPSNGMTTFTRAGTFQFNKLGELVNSADGSYVQGYSINPDTGILGAMGNITIPSDLAPPRATTIFNTNINFDSRTAEGVAFPPAAGTDEQRLADIAGRADYSATLTVYDSLGNAIPLTLYFAKIVPAVPYASQWEIRAFIPHTMGGGLGGEVTVSHPSLGFDNMGSLIGTPPITITLNNLKTGAADNQPIVWDIANAANITNGSVTQYGTVSSLMSKDQNGYTAGTFAGVSIEEGGTVTVMYSNGQLVPLFKLALADFANYTGLKRIGGNQHVETLESGQPNINPAGTGGTGDVTPYSLEMSNVDLSTEFVKMITNQRAFQANCKVITTSDEILAELMMIKR